MTLILLNSIVALATLVSCRNPYLPDLTGKSNSNQTMLTTMLTTTTTPQPESKPLPPQVLFKQNIANSTEGSLHKIDQNRKKVKREVTSTQRVFLDSTTMKNDMHSTTSQKGLPPQIHGQRMQSASHTTSIFPQTTKRMSTTPKILKLQQMMKREITTTKNPFHLNSTMEHEGKHLPFSDSLPTPASQELHRRAQREITTPKGHVEPQFTTHSSTPLTRAIREVYVNQISSTKQPQNISANVVGLSDIEEPLPWPFPHQFKGKFQQITTPMMPLSRNLREANQSHETAAADQGAEPLPWPFPHQFKEKAQQMSTLAPLSRGVREVNQSHDLQLPGAFSHQFQEKNQQTTKHITPLSRSRRQFNQSHDAPMQFPAEELQSRVLRNVNQNQKPLVPNQEEPSIFKPKTHDIPPEEPQEHQFRLRREIFSPHTGDAATLQPQSTTGNSSTTLKLMGTASTEQPTLFRQKRSLDENSTAQSEKTVGIAQNQSELSRTLRERPGRTVESFNASSVDIHGANDMNIPTKIRQQRDFTTQLPFPGKTTPRTKRDLTSGTQLGESLHHNFSAAQNTSKPTKQAHKHHILSKSSNSSTTKMSHLEVPIQQTNTSSRAKPEFNHSTGLGDLSENDGGSRNQKAQKPP